MALKNTLVFTKKTIIIAVLIAVAAVSVFTVSIITYQNSKNKTTSAEVTEQPLFSTIIPKDTTIAQLGGWNRVSPQNSEPVYAYTDEINGVPIIVSQQALPAPFKGNESNAIAELAAQYSATDEITADSTKIYIGTSSKGPQSLIFTKNDLLILIKSEQKVDNKEWSNYVNALI